MAGFVVVVVASSASKMDLRPASNRLRAKRVNILGEQLHHLSSTFFKIRLAFLREKAGWSVRRLTNKKEEFKITRSKNKPRWVNGCVPNWININPGFNGSFLRLFIYTEGK